MTNKINFIFMFLILILINIAGLYYFFRWDLTIEKKYSISKETKKIIGELDDIMYFKIYLHGDIPIEYKKLENETKYILEEFRAHSEFIQYEFIDPSSIENDMYKLSLQEELFNKGITPIPERDFTKTKLEEYLIFPGIVVSYKSKETSVSLINETLMGDRNLIIKKSIDKIEHQLTNGIRKINTQNKQKIGLILGHNETTDQYIRSFRDITSEHYQLIDIEILGKLNALNDLDCIIVNDPKTYFNEKDKFIIDQFIMNGGKSIWILNGHNASMDSLEMQSEIIALPRENRNLEDLLFKYGVRINFDLVQDLQAAPIPVITHYIDDKPQWSLFPWVFFPVISNNNLHLITKSIEPIKTMFPSSMDLIKNNINKTILLQTSPSSKKTQTPALINLENLKKEPNQNLFNDKRKNIAVLLSGNFESLYKNRVNSEISGDKDINFKNQSTTNEMIIISDGNFIKNQFFKNQALPLGLDKHTGVQYGNMDFILNCIDFLLKNKQFIDIRSKNIKSRLLNNMKIKNEKQYWQLINLLSPILILIIFGLTISMIRKKQYKT